MLLVKPDSASHWYLPDRTPFHSVPRADGEGQRSTTLRDARKVGAYPSVTNVLGVLAKPALDAWKQEQAILAALTLPRREGESEDDFAKRVVEDMGAQVNKAADLGSAVHRACEVYAQTHELPEHPGVARLFAPVQEWFDTMVEAVRLVERVVVHHALGFGGTVDLVAKLRLTGTWSVVDFKTQRLKRDTKGQSKPNFYDTWALQLEAYRQGLLAEADGPAPQDIVSVVISSDEPAPVAVKVWPRELLPNCWRAFQCAHHLWTWNKGYQPVTAPYLA